MSKEDMGVSANADRATPEPNPRAVSALRGGIADAALCERLREYGSDAHMRTYDKGFIRKAAERIEDLQLALNWALGVLIHYEPGDSRAVSNEFVAAACIEIDPTDVQSCRDILASAIEARQGPDPKGLDAQHESAAPNGGDAHA